MITYALVLQVYFLLLLSPGFWIGTNFGAKIVETYQYYESFFSWLSPFAGYKDDDDDDKNRENERLERRPSNNKKD